MVSNRFKWKRRKKMRTPAEDPRLPLKAKGLHAYMSTLPVPPRLSMKRILKGLIWDGRNAVHRHMRLLEEYGYLLRWGTRSEKTGTFDRWEYRVFPTKKERNKWLAQNRIDEA